MEELPEAYNPELDGNGKPLKKSRSYTGRKRGPKPIEIDWEAFDKLCFMQCTLTDIAGWFNCSEDTIENKVKAEKKMKFSEYWRLKSASGRISARRVIFEAALNKNLTAAMYLDSRYTKQFDHGADEQAEKQLSDETYTIVFQGAEADEVAPSPPTNAPIIYTDEDEEND